MKTKELTFHKEIKVPTFITCIVCGKQKRIRPANKNKAKYCSYKCYWLGRMGTPAWNKGLKGYLAKENHWCWGKKRLDVSRENNWKWNGGIKTYRKIALENGLLKECVACGDMNPDNLLIHHKDENRHNNKLENLATLCFKCHCVLHKHFNRWGEYAS